MSSGLRKTGSDKKKNDIEDAFKSSMCESLDENEKYHEKEDL